jgi:hypothetical protein
MAESLKAATRGVLYAAGNCGNLVILVNNRKIARLGHVTAFGNGGVQSGVVPTASRD